MTTRGFSLIELTIVLAIIVILAAIAMPRFSRGVEGAAESALVADLANLHRAVEHFAAEHGRLPDPDRVAEQLTRFTDDAGNVSPERTSQFVFGPYLRSIPVLSVGPNRGQNAIATSPAPGIAWIYDPQSGAFAPNLGPEAESTVDLGG